VTVDYHPERPEPEMAIRRRQVTVDYHPERPEPEMAIRRRQVTVDYHPERPSPRPGIAGAPPLRKMLLFMSPLVRVVVPVTDRVRSIGS